MKPLKASYTVEASFLMPLLFFLIIYVLQVGEWMYNSFALEAAAKNSITYGLELLDADEESAEEELRSYAELSATDGLLGNNRITVTEAKLDAEKVSVKITGYMVFPFSGYLRSLGLGSFENYDVECAGTYTNPCSWIRRAELAGEVLEK